MSVNDNALCSLDDVKNFLGITGSKDLDDDLLEDLINRVTELFHTYCGITQFKSQTYTEYHDGEGSKTVFVKNPPIISITTLADDDEWGWASDTVFDLDTYRIVDDLFIVLKDDLFVNAEQNVKVVYVGGYAAIPKDIEQAAIEEVSRKYKHRKDFDVVSKTLDDGSVQYTAKDLLDTTKIVLNRYRRIGIY